MMAVLLSVLVSAYLFFGILYFGRRAPRYNPVRDTISELGESGSPDEKRVSYALFLPVGVGLLLVSFYAEANTTLRRLSLCLAAGYLVAVFFPCDVGSPVGGSWRQQIHNLGGFAEYAGGAWFLYQASAIHTLPLSCLYKAGAIAVAFCTLLLSFPGISIRGLVQRVAEVILFLSVLLLSFSS